MYDKLVKIQESGIWRVIDKINGILLSICGVLAVVTIFANVIARYIFKTDIYGMEEIILVIAFWLYFIGGSNASMENSHIKADLVDVFVKNKVKMYTINGMAKLVEFITMAVLSAWSIDLVVLNAIRMPKTPGLKIPFIVSQIPIAIGFVIMTIFAAYYCLLFFSHAAKIKKGGA